VDRALRCNLNHRGRARAQITPASGFTAGDVDASGSFYSRVEANTWQVDTFGEDLVAVSSADGNLWYLNTSALPSINFVKLNSLGGSTGVPTSNVGVVVTPERFIVALGADGVGRDVEWADQESLTDWDPDTTDQAGTYTLDGQGICMAGRRGRNETLIWTTTDLWGMRYIGGEFVYSFQVLGRACGPIGKLAMGMLDGQAVWMGSRGFFIYDGFVKPLPCDVGDYVFNRLARAQVSKVACDVRSEFNEVWWYYPSSAGTENDSAVVWNYLTNHWRNEVIVRTSGIDRGFLEYPLAASATGAVYEHEKGTLYADEGGSPSYTPYAESGPIELGNGDRLMDIRQFIPDEETLTESRVKVFSRMYPTSTETDHGWFTMANPTDMRVTARQVRLRFEQVTGGFRICVPRLEAIPGSER